MSRNFYPLGRRPKQSGVVMFVALILLLILSLLGVTLGTYEWTWGSEADAGSFTLEIGTTTPLPATLPLFAGGIGVMGLLARRKKRKNITALAAA